MKLSAPAKINLYLAVGGRRSDGLHEIETVMQTVSLADVLTVSAAPGLTLDVSPPGAAPEDESNLVVAAVRALAAAAGRSAGGSLQLHKNIPLGSGLAGGSSDAAATLIGLNELWSTGISRKALEKIAAGIGADVPFCVRGGTAVGSGGGERIAPLVVREPLWWVIAMPPSALSTAEIYEAFDALGDGGSLDSDPSELADALARGDVERIGGLLRNDLTHAAVEELPSMLLVRENLAEAGALGVVMTGSGSAWCGLARNADHAEQIASNVRERVERVWVVRSLDRGPRIVER